MPRFGIAGTGAPGHQQRGEPGEEAGRGVDEDQHAIDVDAADARRLRVAADREDVTAERDLLQEPGDAGVADEEQDGADRDHRELAAEGQRDVGDAEEADRVG